MAKAGLKLDNRDLRELQRDIDDVVNNSMDKTFKKYRSTTPIRSGNARNKTKYTKGNDKFSIKSNYNYAGALDAGSSKQAPKGFTQPSLDYLEKELNKGFRRI